MPDHASNLDMSRLSNAVKVPMIIFVIFVHQNLSLEHDGRIGLLISSIVYVAVPVFFFISGYYFFFRGGGSFGWAEYVGKLRKRATTLLLPYLLWNLLPMLNIIAGNAYSILFRGKSTAALQHYFSDLWSQGVYHIWWDITSGTFPYDSPLWYVRDLIVMCVLSPVVYLLIRKTSRYGVALLVLLYVLGVNTNIVGLSMTAITFFSLGAYFSLNAHKGTSAPPVFAYSHRKALICLTTAAIIIHVAFPSHPFSQPFLLVYTVSGVFTTYYLTGLLPPSVVNRLATMSSSVFFIYALHNTCVLAFVGKAVRLFPVPHIIAILVTPFLTFGVCFLLYCAAKRVCPKVLAILCGGRI